MPAAPPRVYRQHTPYRLLAYGRFVEEKGFQDLIEACLILKKRGIDYQLIMGGEGPYVDTLRVQIEKYSLEDRIELCGWIEDVISYLDSVDLFVLPSRKEPFGLALLEAMARRVPIVATRSEGPSEFLSDREIRFCDVASPASLADGIVDVLTDIEATDTRIINAHRVYKQRYTPSVIIPVVIRHYEDILNLHSSSQTA